MTQEKEDWFLLLYDNYKNIGYIKITLVRMTRSSNGYSKRIYLIF